MILTWSDFLFYRNSMIFTLYFYCRSRPVILPPLPCCHPILHTRFIRRTMCILCQPNSSSLLFQFANSCMQGQAGGGLSGAIFKSSSHHRRHMPLPAPSLKLPVASYELPIANYQWCFSFVTILLYVLFGQIYFDCGLWTHSGPLRSRIDLLTTHWTTDPVTMHQYADLRLLIIYSACKFSETQWPNVVTVSVTMVWSI